MLHVTFAWMEGHVERYDRGHERAGQGTLGVPTLISGSPYVGPLAMNVPQPSVPERLFAPLPSKLAQEPLSHLGL